MEKTVRLPFNLIKIIRDANLIYLSVISPISGTIIFRDAIIGEQVKSGKILFTVSDLSCLWALFEVDEKDLTFIEKGNEVRIKSALYPDKEFGGKITYINDKIDEKLRTFQVRVEVINEDNLLKAKMFVFGIQVFRISKVFDIFTDISIFLTNFGHSLVPRLRICVRYNLKGQRSPITFPFMCWFFYPFHMS
jgi:hypothetical protein